MKTFYRLTILLASGIISFYVHAGDAPAINYESLDDIKMAYSKLRTKKQKNSFLQKVLKNEEHRLSSALPIKTPVEGLILEGVLSEEGSKIRLNMIFAANEKLAHINPLLLVGSSISMTCSNDKNYWLNSVGVPIAIIVGNQKTEETIGSVIIQPGECKEEATQ